MFESANLKAHWAGDRLLSLSKLAEDYAKNCVRVRIECPDFRSGVRQVIYEADPVTPYVPALVGDIARNLRGSLDHAVSAIYRAHGVRDNNAYFPMASTRADLEGIFNGRLAKAGFEELRHLFVDRIRATRAENYPIWALNRIDNANKHRTLSVISQIAFAPIPSYTTADGLTCSPETSPL